MKRGLLISALLLVASPALAHIGSPDIFYEGEAGAYHVLVTIRPPDVVPGLAEIGIRAGGVEQLHLVALPLTADHSAFPPVPDTVERSPVDAQFFTGHLWLMSTGSWQVQLALDGARGHATLAIPVPALPTHVQHMPIALGALLAGFLFFLVVGLVSIISAAAREAQLPAGHEPGPADARRSRIVAIVTAALLFLAVYGGNAWWSASANAYAKSVYQPLTLHARVDPPSRLVLDLADPGWLPFRKNSDFLSDHGHLMHLFVVRMPEMTRMWHLHPEEVAPGRFEQALPAITAGRYALFADVVHEDGLAETLTTDITLGDIAGSPLVGDDSSGGAPALGGEPRGEAPLPDGGRMIWQRPASLRAGEPIAFRFSIQDHDGKPAPDLQPYMGMFAHAAILRDDGSVFVHLHPSGSVPMAALGLAQGEHAGHQMLATAPSEITFPYGFPREGRYRLFVQIRRAGQVQTASFDAQVTQ